MDPVPEEMIWFMLAKEFHWTPKQCKEQNAKDIKAMTHLLSMYNRIKNQEVQRAANKNKSKNIVR